MRTLSRLDQTRPSADAAVVGHDRRPQPVGAFAAQRGGEGLGQVEGAAIERHPDLRVGARAIQPRDFFGGGDASGDGQPGGAGGLDQRRDPVPGEAGFPALALDEGDQEAAREAAQLAHAVQDGAARALGPAFDDHFAFPGIQGRDDPIARETFQHLGDGGRAEDDLRRAAVEPGEGRVPIAYSAAHVARCQSAQLLDDGGVAAASQRGVEVHDGHLAHPAKALGEGAGVAGLEDLAATLDQLHRLAVHEVDGWDDHEVASATGDAMGKWAGARASFTW